MKFSQRTKWLFALLLLAAFVTRFANLGARTMSHDETQHTYFAWLFYKGYGYTHTPLTHGPLQFHLLALSYGLFGDNDTAARVPYALFSVLTVAAVWLFRRHLGRSGTLLAAAMMVISPYLLFYGRYTRNEALVGLFGLLTWWGLLDYLESGRKRALFTLTAATALHFTAKETAFIYTAQALLFLGLLFLWDIFRRPWAQEEKRRPALYALAISLAFLVLGGGFALFGGLNALVSGALLLGLLAALFGLWQIIDGYGQEALKANRPFSLMLVLGTLVLPQLGALPVKALGFDPLDYSQGGMMRTALAIIPLILLAVVLGNWWDAGLWLANAALFYAIFAIFYTSLLTYGAGFFTGLVGALGYWLAQQGVQRGSQPWYYYLLVQVPIYEYLPLLASLLGVGYLLRSLRPHRQPPPNDPQVAHPLLFPLFALYWSVTAFVAYTIAGEKMPWLTYHITLPMILLGGWALGRLVERISWEDFRQQHGWAVLAVLPVFGISLAAAQASLTQWSQLLASPSALIGALTALVCAFLCGWALLRWLNGWTPGQTLRALLLAFFALAAVLTARTAVQAAYLHADEATEFLVYAHSAPANKRLYRQFKELSQRLYGDLSIKIAYDNSDGKGDPGAAWPLSWYLRNFPNTLGFGPEPPTDLRSYDVVVVSDVNWERVDPLLRRQYDVFEVNRMWWPMQDYFDLTWERIAQALGNPQMRAALFQIWLNRDYTLYGQITGKELHPPVWDPARKMRVYVRKEIAAQLWAQTNAPTGGAPSPGVSSPYESARVPNPPLKVIQNPEMQAPRGVAIAPDGSIYISDTAANRIFHFDAEGNLLHSWGEYGVSEAQPAPPGTFNEPWGVAVGPDGSVYVADTWNHRIQKFTADGQFLTMWGVFGQVETPDAFWGPRDVAVDAQGRVFVSDTGNKRIAIFDADGQPLSQTTAGFNEQVGLALDANGRIFAADTWNQRVVILDNAVEGVYAPAGEWHVEGWYGQSLDNKPYIAVLPDDRVAVSDPEGFRILVFRTDGSPLVTWGDDPDLSKGLGLPTGLAADATGNLWVADTATGRVLYFAVPTPPEQSN